MKRGIVILIVALAAGILAFCMIRTHKIGARPDVLLDSLPELAWLQSELKLNNRQLEEISELHAAYRPKCMDMCRRIAATREKVDELIRQNHQVTPELEQALREHAATRAECQQAMLGHIFQTAKMMDHDQAEIYLREVLPFALDSNHNGNIHAR